MKKNLLSLALAMSLLLVLGITANAEETTALNPKEHYNQRVEERQQKIAEKSIERTLAFEEKKSKAVTRQGKKLELIDQYAEDMVDLYIDAFADHTTVHELLFETHKSLRLEVKEITELGVTAIKDELLPQVEEGLITRKDMDAAIKVYLEEQKAYFTSVRDQYKAEIEVLNVENAVNKEIVDGLKADLRAAIESDDKTTAETLIIELYDYLLNHTQYDYDKLEVLEAIEF